MLKHIPKGARASAAGKLNQLIEKCVDSNDTTDWHNLLTFSYRALRVPDRSDIDPLQLRLKRMSIAIAKVIFLTSSAV